MRRLHARVQGRYVEQYHRDERIDGKCARSYSKFDGEETKVELLLINDGLQGKCEKKLHEAYENELANLTSHQDRILEHEGIRNVNLRHSRSGRWNCVLIQRAEQA